VSNVDIYETPGLGLPGSGYSSSYILLNLASDPSLTPEEPVAGTPIVETAIGNVVDVIMQDLPAGSLGGINLNRTSQEEHPMHLHGHHFYVLGSGIGVYEELAKDQAWLDASLNFVNPQMRDTETLPKGGWLYLRFRSDNPGVWPLHCHIQAHEFMGMVMLFGEDLANVPAVPADVRLPSCTDDCVHTAKIYNTSEIATAPAGAGQDRPPEVVPPIPSGSPGLHAGVMLAIGILCAFLHR
jgi:hypothetical protein